MQNKEQMITKIKFSSADRWQLICSFRGGASYRTWKNYGGRNSPTFDERTYGDALEENYPGLKQNAQGDGHEAALAAMKDGLKRRSTCLTTAALLANARVDKLDKPQQALLSWLIQLAKSDPELKHIFSI